MEASSSSTPIQPRLKYDVYLSFRGEDTGRAFIGPLRAALELNGICTFRDNIELERGKSIAVELPKAIEASKISLVVLSENYAASRWCLDDLVKIMKCKKTFGHIVLPIFYNVTPSDVRRQKGSFAEAFAKHEKRYKEDSDGKLNMWRAALAEVANLNGWILRDLASGIEAEFIQIIVEEVKRKLKLVHLSDASYLVGIEPRLQCLTKMLRMESNDVRIVAIWGIRGIGKTTIAKAAYDLIHSNFERSCFVTDLKETSKQLDGLVLLQKRFLDDILGSGNHNIRNFNQGIEVIKRKVFCQRVLLVLDDVNDIQQLEALAIDQKFLHPGSRIIITTRNISSLSSLRLADEFYVPELNKVESRQLFSWYAFGKDLPMEDYVELLDEFVECSRGVPSVLKDLGSFLFMKSKSDWVAALAQSGTRKIHDVFLSFHGKDTRTKFTDHLFETLKLRGIDTFRDDPKLNRGKDFRVELPKAIEDSIISLVVFSKNYADSEWCLDEIVKMMECSKAPGAQHIVIPIFYGVKPAEVRHQKGSVADALGTHQNCGKKEQWKASLTEFSYLSGLEFKENEGEAQFVLRIVEEVEKQLNQVRLSVADHPVGIECRRDILVEMLNLKSDDTSIVAILGNGGIGKTEIAKVVYNRIYIEFKGSSCFVADVRETSNQPNGMVLLQKQILSDILKIKDPNIGNVHQGIELMKKRVFCRRVLLVLDDVDDPQQLRELAIDRKFLCPGSKIIITSRLISSVDWLEEFKEYKPRELDEHESLELFSWHAFKQDHPKEEYKDLSNKVVSSLIGIPLALEVLGSHLYMKDISFWKSSITNLLRISNDKVQKKLKISFDSLSEEVKELFLDIACFFVGSDRDFALKILEGCAFYPENGFWELVERGLVKCHALSNRIMMHDLLRDMGREIVKQESFKEPGERTRVWDHSDALEVLIDGTGTKKVEGLFLNFPEPREVEASAKSFKKMRRLRLLHLNYVHLSVGCELIISRRLAWLCWKGFPLECLPLNLCMGKLVALDLCYSSLNCVWEGTKTLDKLKFLHLSHCQRLTKTPDLSGLVSLEELFLNDCTSLLEVDESITSLHKLLVLDVKNCKELQKLPRGIWMLKSLEYLDLSGCSSLRSSAGFKGSPSTSWNSFLPSWISPTSVDSSLTPVNQLASVEGSSRLKLLNMADCNLPDLPNEMGCLTSLTDLNLSGNTFRMLPDSIGDLPNLKSLNVERCARLQSLTILPASLESLQAQYCTSLESISMESNWKKLPSVICYGCPKLAENNFADSFSKGLLQFKELSAVESSFDISLTGGEVPSWFHYQSTEMNLSFVAPKEILGWIFCASFSHPKECDILANPGYRVRNDSKGHEGTYWSRHPISPTSGGQDVIWLCYLPMRAFTVPVQVDDKVEISLLIDEPLQVKNWGLTPIGKVEEEKEEEKEKGKEEEEKGEEEEEKEKLLIQQEKYEEREEKSLKRGKFTVLEPFRSHSNIYVFVLSFILVLCFNSK